MSVLQSLPPKLREAVEELQKIQHTRRKARMEFPIQFGNGVARFMDSIGNLLLENSGNVLLKNYQGKFELSIGIGQFPCDNITCYNCVNTKITFELVEGFAAKTCILELESTEQVNRVISHIKPPPKPRAQTYQHDGNVTSSDTDSEGSCRGKTRGVDNSFDSDDPPSHDSP